MGAGPAAQMAAGANASRWTGGGASLLGVAPFFLFAVLFLILPTLSLVFGAFQDNDGRFYARRTSRNSRTPSILAAYWISIRISVASSVVGAAAGFAIALAIIRGGLPDWIRSATLTFSGVASNFAGVPLAFAFLATLGRLGLVTVLLNSIGVSIYALGFNLLSFWGLTLTYFYFQIPLMILIIAPAIDGLKREWSEAASSLGATRGQFWRMVAFPILWPSILGTMISALRQRLRRNRHGLCAHRIVAQHRADPALCADPRRRAA